MARMQRGILGGLRGKIGNVVGSNWKGIDTLRSLPISVANPRSAGQVAQRTKFTAVVGFASTALTSIVKPLWDRFAQYESGYNAFVSANINAYSSDGVVDTNKIVTSRGSLTPAARLGATLNSNGIQVTLTWVNNAGVGSALNADLAYMAVYHKRLDTWYFGQDTPHRIAEEGNVFVTGSFASGDEMVAYVAFRRADGSIVSDSVLFNITVP